MLLSRRLTGVVAGLLTTVSLTAPAQAQDAAKAQFEGLYAELRTALEAHDAASLDKLLAPEYAMLDIRGNAHDRAAVMERMAKMPQGAGSSALTTVLSASITGDSAAVKQQLAASGKRAGDDREEHTMEMVVLSDDTWVKRGDGWLLTKSEQKELTVKRDGEVFFHEAK